MGYIWEFNSSGDIFTYNDIVVKASDLCYIDENNKIRSVVAGAMNIAYIDDDNIIRNNKDDSVVSVGTAGKIGTSYEYKDDDFDAKVNIYYKVDTTNKEITISLPEDAEDNDTLYLLDVKGTWGDNKVTLHRTNDDHLVMGEQDDGEIDINNYYCGVIYCDGDWRIM